MANNESKSKKDAKRSQWHRFWKVSNLSLKVGGSYLKQKARETLSRAEDLAPQRMQTHIRNAERIVETLGELKGPLMKVGQMLSLNEEILPKAFTERLATLQRQAPAEDFEIIQQQIEVSFGKPLKAIFPSIDPEPIGCSNGNGISTVQMHEGQGRPFSKSEKAMWAPLEEAVDSQLHLCGVDGSARRKLVPLILDSTTLV